MFRTKKEFKKEFENACLVIIGKDFEDCSTEERYFALAKLVSSQVSEMHTQKISHKKIYYFSMEFLIGKLLENYLMNLGLTKVVSEGLADMGESLEEYFEIEKDPGLGNGGLGRLAACFMDSLAALGYEAEGVGIRYRFGLFKQRIENGQQVEDPDNWLEKDYPWEVKHLEAAVPVKFGGRVEKNYDGSEMHYQWLPEETILAVPYDIPIVGYDGKQVNTLRMWSAKPMEEGFDMDAFNRGDYAKANKHRADVQAITDILYPNDHSLSGRVLRLKQEYMFTAAGIQDIVNSFKKQYGNHWELFSQKVAIHTNDTHPAVSAPELMRVLMDQEDLGWDLSWKIATESISYTNHTILPEALEKWPIDMFRNLLPRLYDIIEEIDRRYRDSLDKNVPGWQEQLKNTAILWDGQVHMANLSVIVSHHVNGVADLHTEILKKIVLKDFYSLTPEKFNNKTNGISHRRFFVQANPSYQKLLSETIGNTWIHHPEELEKLKDYEEKASFLEKVEASKKENKLRLAKYIKKTTGIDVHPNSIFDVQVKRFHAYKRQLLNVLKIMDLYNRLLADPNFHIHPVTFIFAGKAAQGYAFAKDVIRLICSIADVINRDNRVNRMMKLVFIPNFSVSNAQLIYPAAEISEQISTAGMEASGTGNMKFMMNGAITLGTLDGANVEISQLVGPDNIKIFGLKADEIETMKSQGGYLAWTLYHENNRIKKVLDQLIDGTYSHLSGGFDLIYDSLLRDNDSFFVLKDFESYVNAFEELIRVYDDKKTWWKMSIHNTAYSGYFSSDRTIEEYVKEIWEL
ncbi:glycogen/starch/alpha-glucan phosphorylase [Bulleidia sp. zg-1006]|uniref:glycogen/starch/alpha-glucan phosphorylase n=1 Tax=Bulleidia sp. zg-1006 TaxID=2806552 RepID=UPI00193AB67B|nr:glycogen/starch/alpha-glucan phosphorylase [Bulleidia sp. zg-1006]QRG87200.1 glycogen/starch/alpha-glucan phosphorylase [Bulleidia sp. zg-1006]